MDKHKQDFDFSQITEYIFLGTNLCCDISSHMEFLEKIDVTADIDLEEERQDAPPRVDVYLWLPVKNKNAPNEAQFDIGVALIDQLVKNKKKIYIHCQLGHGRSPTLVAAYFIKQGMGVDEALAKIKAARPEIHLEDIQYQALKEYERSISTP